MFLAQRFYPHFGIHKIETDNTVQSWNFDEYAETPQELLTQIMETRAARYEENLRYAITLAMTIILAINKN